MTVKIAVTMCDVGDAIHGGGDPRRLTSIIELRADQIPVILREYLEEADAIRVMRSEKPVYSYKQVSFSLMEE